MCSNWHVKTTLMDMHVSGRQATPVVSAPDLLVIKLDKKTGGMKESDKILIAKPWDVLWCQWSA